MITTIRDILGALLIGLGGWIMTSNGVYKLCTLIRDEMEKRQGEK
jgi:hypothetical protein